MSAKEKAQLMVELERAGNARQAALDRAAQYLDEIALLAPRAVGAGVTKAEISRLARISRPTLDGLLGGTR
jgi:hypothetical protein